MAVLDRSIRLDRTPTQAIERIEAVLGLTPRELAFVLDTDLRSINRWRTGNTYPQREARAGLAQLLELAEDLAEVFGEDTEATRGWLNDPSRYLRDLRPIDLIRARRTDQAVAALEALRSGVFV